MSLLSISEYVRVNSFIVLFIGHSAGILFMLPLYMVLMMKRAKEFYGVIRSKLRRILNCSGLLQVISMIYWSWKRGWVKEYAGTSQITSNSVLVSVV